jgi:hypothetical protein
MVYRGELSLLNVHMISDMIRHDLQEQKGDCALASVEQACSETRRR